jgi:hypothetical protein
VWLLDRDEARRLDVARHEGPRVGDESAGAEIDAADCEDHRERRRDEDEDEDRPCIGLVVDDQDERT